MDGPVPAWLRCHRLRAGVLALLAVATAAIAGPPSHDATSHRRFDDPAYWSKVFDDPGRAEWQKPTEVAAALGLRPGQTVADLGAGTGYFTRPLADAVGPSGTVLAVDVEPNLVAYMSERAAREHLSNVRVVLADALHPAFLAAALVCVIVFFLVLFGIKEVPLRKGFEEPSLAAELGEGGAGEPATASRTLR